MSALSALRSVRIVGTGLPSEAVLAAPGAALLGLRVEPLLVAGGVVEVGVLNGELIVGAYLAGYVPCRLRPQARPHHRARQPCPPGKHGSSSLTAPWRRRPSQPDRRTPAYRRLTTSVCGGRRRASRKRRVFAAEGRRHRNCVCIWTTWTGNVKLIRPRCRKMAGRADRQAPCGSRPQRPSHGPLGWPYPYAGDVPKRTNLFQEVVSIIHEHPAAGSEIERS